MAGVEAVVVMSQAQRVVQVVVAQEILLAQAALEQQTQAVAAVELVLVALREAAQAAQAL
jgi:hypothetical protein